MKDGESPEARLYLSDRIAKKITVFEEYWKMVFDKAGERKRWTTVLSRPLRGTKEG